MSSRLVTIATFDEPAKARLAQNALKDAAIQSVVADETLVSMDWLLSQAVGGVKVQVREEDSDRAVAALEGAFGKDGSGLESAPVDIDQLTAEAEAETPEEEPPRLEDGEEREPSYAPESREDYVRRMVFAAMLGLFFPPVAFYALYLFLNAAFGEGELSTRGRLHLWIGGAMMLAGLLFVLFLFGALL